MIEIKILVTISIIAIIVLVMAIIYLSYKVFKEER